MSHAARRLRIASSLSTLLAGTPAAAAPLTLELRDCADLDQTKVERILNLELRSYLATDRGGPTTVEVTCVGTLTKLSVNDTGTDKVTTRSLDLSGVSSVARPRTVALAVAELVAWSWTELLFTRARESTQPEPAIAARPTLPATPAESAAVDRISSHEVRRTAWHGEALGSFRLPLRTAAPLVGGSVALSARLLGLRWFTDVAAHGGNWPIPHGSVDLLTADLRLGLGEEYVRDHWALEASVGWRAGALRYQTSSNEAARYETRNLVGAWLGPSALLGGRLRLSSVLTLAASGEVGYAPWSPRGQVIQARTIDLAGGWLGLRLGLGISS